MARITKFYHDPQAVLDYGKNWATWLEEGETLVSSDWSVPDGITLVQQSYAPTGQTVVRIAAWTSTVGDSHIITNHVASSDGQEEDSSYEIVIREK